MTFWWTSWLDVIIVHRMTLPTSLGISESTDNIVVEGACSLTHTDTPLSLFQKNVEKKKIKDFRGINSRGCCESCNHKS